MILLIKKYLSIYLSTHKKESGRIYTKILMVLSIYMFYSPHLKSLHRASKRSSPGFLVWGLVSPQRGHRKSEKYPVLGFPGWYSCKLTRSPNPTYFTAVSLVS